MRTESSDKADKAEKPAALVALGQQIRKVRQAKGFSQEDFAAHAELDRSYYGGVERGERNIAALNLIKIAVALNMEIGELFPTLSVFQSLLVDEASDSSESAWNR